MSQRIDSDMARYEGDKQAFARRMNQGLADIGIPERGRPAELQRRLQNHPSSQDPAPSLTAIRKWLEGDSLPEVKRLSTLADIIGRIVSWLLTGKDTPLEPIPGRELPILTYVQVAALFNNRATTLLNGDEEFIVSPVRVSHDAFAMRVHGDTMVSTDGNRSYPEGTIIVVDPDVPYEHGRRVVALAGGDATFKELVYETGTWYLRPLNQQYRVVELGPNPSICGVVVCSIQIE